MTKISRLDLGPLDVPKKLTREQLALIRRLARQKKVAILLRNGHKVHPDGKVENVNRNSTSNPTPSGTSSNEKMPGRKPLVQKTLDKERRMQGKEPIERETSSS